MCIIAILYSLSSQSSTAEIPASAVRCIDDAALVLASSCIFIRALKLAAMQMACTRLLKACQHLKRHDKIFHDSLPGKQGRSQNWLRLLQGWPVATNEEGNMGEEETLGACESLTTWSTQ